ncbi:MAG TPA: carboxypeptidase-like regulatory domain-containing protein [Gemmatimonadales bacterium]|nr:carboxypeptidase-like regulatory domain-containing protein [Gemmatimonadales bacterium]
MSPPLSLPQTSRAASALVRRCLFLSLVFARPAPGQNGALSGTVTAGSGVAISGAQVSLRNLTTADVRQAMTDSSGNYRIEDLLAGDYELSVSASGYRTGTQRVTIAAGEARNANVTLTESLALGDLGFTTEQTQGNAADQARLDRRSHMLKWHQRFGLLTAASFVATLVSSTNAGGRRATASGRDWHAGLGILNTGLYFTTAYFAIFAPKIPGAETHGQIRIHKALAWVHGTGMIVTPILGAMAFNQRSNGQRVTGAASYHGAAAAVTTIAFGLAIISVSVKF